MMINKQKLVNPENLPVIAGVEISTDMVGRFNLNALHRASGLGPNKAPTQWLRTQSAKQLIEELEKETMQNCIVSLEGRNGGTFAHELLAVEYAGWISPAFRLQVNQTFIDYRTGKLTAGNNQLPNFDDPIAAAEAWIEAKKSERLALGYAERQARYISKLESHLADGITPVQFCKQLNGVNTRQINAFLEERNWLYDDRPEAMYPRWRVKAYARDQYLTERSGQVEQENGEMREIFKPLLKKKGAAWLYRHYLNGELPMKKTWDGLFTHNTELANLLQESK
ncbi:KilA-N domain-containing protein [Escherichia coli]|uniref:KilA-N domain-containing protein n=1 Tax=Escherichia coli TaxID=562 RepID=UPI000420B5BF|nr:KilA-N domain-containing protein [Escherichia coli]EEW1988944.1 KilA-N domain-containing protein [Escherichia coli]EEW2141988.1 KilA-N domain-containing protein [Escherichia coli]EEW2341163.1 KilA-N domain-containing protein [Escherichia coli]EFA7486063.1 KilA-N domain-containing protein [Escherichia coli]EFA7746469.1 KilA-N domain-containing protein [Escherichia coli]